MRIYYSATSPFVRKCLVAAHELGIRDRLELLPASPHPINRSAAIVAHNPLGKAPTLITDDGVALYDSRVICEYLNSCGDGRLLPAQGAARWAVLVEQALGDGILDAAVLARYETALRPERLRWNDWTSGQIDKVESGLAQIERTASDFGERVDMGTIALACALGYLDLRFADLAWRDRYPAAAAWYRHFAARDSMTATLPPAT